ncbi:FMN-binding protein [Sinomonas sp. P47F7]|uniref:FMN-binding protein n=1 Tax=Sinomonas sp. P47F7 TaxID=3410987 RepID=UPI003BF4E71F
MRARAAAAAALASAGILAAGWQAGAQAIEASSAAGVAKTGTDAGTGAAGTASAGGSAASAGSGSANSGSSSSGSANFGSANSGSASGTGGSSGSQGSSSSAGLKAGTFTGPSEDTRFGSVQVQIVVAGGKITDVKSLHLTDAERRSQMISAYAAPILRTEVLKAQSVSVDTVSGATITSDAYLSSLQGALDAAHA